MKLSMSTSNLLHYPHQPNIHQHNKQNAAMQLHDFKMNLGKTLNSNFLQQFNTTKKDLACNDGVYKKRKSKKMMRTVTFSKVSTPCIPVKVNSNAIYYNSNNSIASATCQKSKMIRKEIYDTDHSSNESSDLDLANDEVYSAFFTMVSEENKEDTNKEILKNNNNNSSLNHSISISSNSSTNTMLSNKTDNQSDSGLSSLNSAQLFFAEIREFLVKDFAEQARAATIKLNENTFTNERISKSKDDQNNSSSSSNNNNSALFASSSLLSSANKISNQINSRKYVRYF
jgi:hypothetical protein